uniref:Uncharacterized protein n=1 Tax=Romanomermis culicivorax TaxID=13658 RepID=A0A915J2C8_ROMCU
MAFLASFKPPTSSHFTSEFFKSSINCSATLSFKTRRNILGSRGASSSRRIFTVSSFNKP